MIQIFRRENSPYETAVFKIRGLNKNVEYMFNDADGGNFSIAGDELMENGFKISIPEKRTAKMFFYKEV